MFAIFLILALPGVIAAIWHTWLMRRCERREDFLSSVAFYCIIIAWILCVFCSIYHGKEFNSSIELSFYDRDVKLHAIFLGFVLAALLPTIIAPLESKYRFVSIKPFPFAFAGSVFLTALQQKLTASYSGILGVFSLKCIVWQGLGALALSLLASLCVFLYQRLRVKRVINTAPRFRLDAAMLMDHYENVQDRYSFPTIRSFPRRFLLALLPVTLFFAMLYIFGPTEVYFGNLGEFAFSYSDFVFAMLAKAVLYTLICALVISLLPERVFYIVLCIVLGIGIAAYTQLMFFNESLKANAGVGVDWSEFTPQLACNTIIWLVLIGLPIAAGIVFRKYRKLMITVGSAFLLCVQLAGAASLVFSHPEDWKRTYEEVGLGMTGDAQFTVSENKNIIVFLLDYFSNDYLTEILAAYPDALEPLKDFTYYSNADSTYFSTFPSVSHMLTSYPYDNTKTIDEWHADSWNSARANAYYDALAKAGYRSYVFSTCFKATIGQATDMQGKIANIALQRLSDIQVNRDLLTKQLLLLSGYRLAPYLIKPKLAGGSEFLSTSVVRLTYQSGEIPLYMENFEYFEALKQHGLRTDASSNYFIFQHLNGTHQNYTTNEYCEQSDKSVTSLAQTGKGCLYLLDHYFNELKRLGVYDDATIIVTSDHGDAGTCPQIIYFIKTAGETHDSYLENTAPISHKEFMPTVLDAAGALDAIDDGDARSIFDIDEDEERERTVTFLWRDDAYPLANIYKSAEKAWNNVLYVFKYTGDRNALKTTMEQPPSEIIPILHDTTW